MLTFDSGTKDDKDWKHQYNRGFLSLSSIVGDRDCVLRYLGSR